MNKNNKESKPRHQHYQSWHICEGINNCKQSHCNGIKWYIFKTEVRIFNRSFFLKSMTTYNMWRILIYICFEFEFSPLLILWMNVHIDTEPIFGSIKKSRSYYPENRLWRNVKQLMPRNPQDHAPNMNSFSCAYGGAEINIKKTPPATLLLSSYK